MSLFDSETIEIPCPECGRNHPKTIGWIKANAAISCPCGVTINLDKDQFVREITGVEEALDAIPREIRFEL